MSNVISFDVYKNTMRRTAGLAPVSSESGYSAIECNFKEGDDWVTHLTVVTAGFFVSEDEVYPTEANIDIANNKAVFKIPGALVNNTNPIYFGITGSYGSNPEVTIATNVVKLDVVRGVVITAGDPSSDPYADLYQQLLALVNEAVTGKMEKLESGDSGKVLVSAAGGQSERSDYEITNTADDITNQTSNKLPSAAAVGVLINSVQTILSGKANSSDVYTKSAVDTALAGKASTVGGGSSKEIITATGGGDIQRSGKHFASSIGDGSTGMVPTTKAVKDALDTKANSSDVYTKSAVDTALSSKAAAEHTHSQYLTQHQDITGKEDKSNKVTSMTAQSTDDQYPSAKAVYDELGSKADTSDIPTKTSDLDNDSGFLTSHQSLANYYNKTEVDTALAGKAAAEHTHSQYLTQHQDISGKEDKSNKDTGNSLDQSKIKYPSNYTVRKHLIDNYYDKTTIDDTTYTKEEVNNALSSKADSADIPTKMSDLTNDSGFMPIVEVSSIDSCTEEKVLYRVKIGNYTSSYIFNVIHPAIWGQFKIDVNSGGILYRAKLRAYPDAPWGQFDDFIAFEDTFYKVTSLTAQSTDDQYPSAKAVYDALSGKANASHSHTGMENTSNKVTSISSSSTDNQYPTAKCVYDLIGDIETLLSQI